MICNTELHLSSLIIEMIEVFKKNNIKDLGHKLEKFVNETHVIVPQEKKAKGYIIPNLEYSLEKIKKRKCII